MASMLHELGSETDRLLWAGAVAARGDASLRRRREALATLGAKVPALGRTGELCQAVLDAADDAVGGALLQLVCAAGQLRAAGFELARAGELAPLAPKLDVTTMAAAPLRELYAVRDALSSKKKPPEALAAMLVDARTVADPRLWPAISDGFKHTYLRGAVAQAAAMIGEPILPQLEKAFRPKGGDEEAARLDAIAGIRKAAGESLYRGALENASFPVQLAALRALRFVGDEAMTSAAEALLPKVKDPLALALALLPVATGKLLATLIDHVDNGAYAAWQLAPLLNAAIGADAQTWIAGDESLDAPEGARQRLTALIAQVAKKPPASRGQFAKRDALWRLALHKKADGAVAYVASFLESPEPAMRQQAAEHLAKFGDEAACELVIAAAERDGAFAVSSVDALLRLGDAVALERLRPLYQPYLQQREALEKKGFWGKVASVFASSPSTAPTSEAPKGPPDPRLAEALSRVRAGFDKRWAPVALALLRHLPAHAALALSELREAGALPELVAFAKEKPRQVDRLYRAIGAVGGAQAVPFLAGVLASTTNIDELSGALWGLQSTGDASAIAPIEALLTRTDQSLVVASANRVLKNLKA